MSRLSQPSSVSRLVVAGLAAGTALVATAGSVAAADSPPEPIRELATGDSRPEPIDDLTIGNSSPEPIDDLTIGDGRPEPIDDFAAVSCERLPIRSIAVQMMPNGKVRLTAPDDGVPTCNESIVITSYAGAGPVVDNHDPVVDSAVVMALDLEAAGPSGIQVPIDVDPCWASVQVLLDGDTFVWEDAWGDGCELTVTSNFPGSPWPTEIHVVQQTGNIQPPHIVFHDVSQTTELTGLPDGTWYVKVYDGALPETEMSVDGGASQQVSTVYDVADGSEVVIDQPWMDTDI